MPSASSHGYVDLFANQPVGTEMNIATVYRCVALLSGSVAALPLLHEVKKGDIFCPSDGVLNGLLNLEPNEYSDAVVFWEMIVQSLLLEGNAYIVPTRNPLTGDIWRMAVVNPKCVLYDTMTDEYTINDADAGISGTFKEKDVIHIKNFTRDGKRGISTLTFARLSTKTALAAENESFERFGNGGNVRGFVSNDTAGVRGFGDYADKELSKAAQGLDFKLRSGARIVSIPGSAKFSPITLSSQDMQFLDSKKLNGLDICRFFNVPPQLVFYDTTSNYKTAEMAWVSFLNGGLSPLLRKIEKEFARKLIGIRNYGKERIMFDRKELYDCDLESRAKYQAATIATGIYTVNEWRAAENKASVEGGDKVLVSANLKDILHMETTGKPSKEPKDEDKDEQ